MSWFPLGEAWRFPSDHLPVAAAEQQSGVVVASWNVMDTRFINMVAGQGLSGSLITQQHIPLISSNHHTTSLTVRDAVVLKTVLQLATKASVIALQECSAPFLRALDGHLKAMTTFRRAENSRAGDAVVIYDESVLNLRSVELYHGANSPFSGRGSRPGKPATMVEFETADDGHLLRVLGCKIGGDPSGIHLKEYARFIENVIQQPKGQVPTVMVGDFNFMEHEVDYELTRLGIQACFGTCPNPAQSARYNTNINPGDPGTTADMPLGFGGGPYAPKRIDHVISLYTTTELMEPEELLPGLGTVVQVMSTGIAESGDTLLSWDRPISIEAASKFVDWPCAEAAPGEVHKSSLPPLNHLKYTFQLALQEALTLQKSPSQQLACDATEHLKVSAQPVVISRKFARRILNLQEVSSTSDPHATGLQYILNQDLGRVQNGRRSRKKGAVRAVQRY